MIFLGVSESSKSDLRGFGRLDGGMTGSARVQTGTNISSTSRRRKRSPRPGTRRATTRAPATSTARRPCERCTFEADRGRDKEFVRLSYYCTSYGLDIPIYRLGLACDKVLAQLPLNKHGRNPSNYGETKVH